MRFFCLVNPVAGGRKGKALLENLTSLRLVGQFEGQVEELSQTALSEQLNRARDYDCILIAGGDGSISEVISAMDSNFPPVGLLPLGTGNDLAKEIGIYKKFSRHDPLKILEFYKSAESKPLSIWKLECGKNFEIAEKFMNYVSFGMDATVVDRFSNWRKSKNYRLLSWLGIYGNRIGYSLAGMKHINSILDLAKTKIKSSTQEISLKKARCKTLIFANIKSMMGLGISNTYSTPFDDKIELIVSNSILNYVAMLLKHKGPVPKPKLLGSDCEWLIENLPEGTKVQIDGEAKSNLNFTTYRISHSGSINLFVG